MLAVAIFSAAFALIAALAAASQAQSAKTQAEEAQKQARESQTQAETARRHAGAAEEHVKVARQQVEVAQEQLRLMRADRDTAAETERTSQARSVFLSPAKRRVGGSYSDSVNRTSTYPTEVRNGSKGEITDVWLTLTVDVGDGREQRFDHTAERLNPDEKLSQDFKVTSPATFKFEDWKASVEVVFTDARGQRWLIDNGNNRIETSG